MYLIADGGISTKNTLVNTKGAISLSINTSYISGISLNVAYTKDEVFIIADRDSLMFTTKGSGYIKNNTYNDLLHYNVGTKVLNARVVTLKEVLDIYNKSNKMLHHRNDGSRKLFSSLIWLKESFIVSANLSESTSTTLLPEALDRASFIASACLIFISMSSRLISTAT